MLPRLSAEESLIERQRMVTALMPSKDAKPVVDEWARVAQLARVTPSRATDATPFGEMGIGVRIVSKANG